MMHKFISDWIRALRHVPKYARHVAAARVRRCNHIINFDVNVTKETTVLELTHIKDINTYQALDERVIISMGNIIPRRHYVFRANQQPGEAVDSKFSTMTRIGYSGRYQIGHHV